MNMNLNELKVNNVEPDINYERTKKFKNEKFEICVDGIEAFVISKIKEYDAVCGCVAWLTNKNIINELSKKKNCQLLVQKEDFLRPDNNVKTKPQYWKLYKKIKGIEYKEHFGLSFDFCACEPIEGVRCVGTYNKSTRTYEKMHHKFIVLYEETEQMVEFGENEYYPRAYFIPKAVITGSFNYTDNGTNSLENVIYIKDEDVARFYHNEYYHVLMLSEKLDWTSNYSEPQFRIGT